MSNTLRIEISKDWGKYTEGQIVRVPANERGVPTNPFWRARLKDAETDDCCKVIEKDQAKGTEPKKSTGKKDAVSTKSTKKSKQ